MSTDHGHGHDHDHDVTTAALDVNASAPWPHSSDDPTATKSLRDRYEGEMYRRFRALKGAVVEGVVENDAFGLSRNPRANADREGVANARRRVTRLAANRDDVARALGFNSADDAERSFRALADPGINITPPEPGQFAFPSDERKVREFDSWLTQQTDRAILERGRHEGRDIVASDSWQNTYIRSSYEKGATHADDALVRDGIIPPEQALDDVFRATKHADAAGMMYVRAYDELDGVTSAMGQQMSRELTDGLTQGENPRKMARRLNDRVDKVGLHRGRLIARTETIRAHNEAAINRYEDMGDRIDGVQVVVEHTTAGDHRVCPECIDLAGRQFTPEDARGRIPVHPNCRCTFIPIQQDRGEPDRIGEQADRLVADDAVPPETTAARIGEMVTRSTGTPTENFGALGQQRAARVAHGVEGLDRAGEWGPAPIGRLRAVDDDSDALAWFDWADDTLALNTNKFTAEKSRELINDGWLTGDVNNPLMTTLTHEVGHARHKGHLVDKRNTDGVAALESVRGRSLTATERGRIDARVSEYGSQSPAEAVAEIYTKAHMSGEAPSDGILGIYNDLEGPPVTDLADLGTNALVGNADPADDEPSDDLPPELVDEYRATTSSFYEWLDGVIAEA